jgi:hypothetical protein
MYSWNKTPGYTAVESDGLASQLNPAEGQGEKLVEMWRHLHPDAVGEYTYYSCVSPEPSLVSFDAAEQVQVPMPREGHRLEVRALARACEALTCPQAGLHHPFGTRLEAHANLRDSPDVLRRIGPRPCLRSSLLVEGSCLIFA